MEASLTDPGKGLGMAGLEKDEVKEALKEAIKEWMDAKYTALGKWAAGTFVALVIYALTWLILKAYGWKLE